MDFTNFSPCFLVAMPQLKDPNFEKSVVLLSEFSEKGAVGFVINRPSDLLLGPSIVLQEGSINPDYQNTTLWTGGPVEPNLLWIFFEGDEEEAVNGVNLGDGVFLANDVSLLLNHEKTISTKQLKVVNGYAGWGAQQLEAEIASSNWITAPVQKDLIFTISPEKIWETAISRLGISAKQIHQPNSVFLN